MALALSPSNPPLSSLIVADIAPSKGKMSPEFMTYVEAMKRIENANVSTRQDATKILHEYEKVSARLLVRYNNVNSPFLHRIQM
jgi:hypothetical protein